MVSSVSEKWKNKNACSGAHETKGGNLLKYFLLNVNVFCIHPVKKSFQGRFVDTHV